MRKDLVSNGRRSRVVVIGRAGRRGGGGGEEASDLVTNLSYTRFNPFCVSLQSKEKG